MPCLGTRALMIRSFTKKSWRSSVGCKDDTFSLAIVYTVQVLYTVFFREQDCELFWNISCLFRISIVKPTVLCCGNKCMNVASVRLASPLRSTVSAWGPRTRGWLSGQAGVPPPRIFRWGHAGKNDLSPKIWGILFIDQLANPLTSNFLGSGQDKFVNC